MTDSARDRAADQAYRDHANDVYRVAYGILRDPDEALDATHDTFARAWERWDQYDSQRPLGAGCTGSWSTSSLDQLRRRRVRRLALPLLGRSPSARSSPRRAGSRRRRRPPTARRPRARRAAAAGPGDARPAPLLRLRLRPDRHDARDDQRHGGLDAVARPCRDPCPPRGRRPGARPRRIRRPPRAATPGARADVDRAARGAPVTRDPRRPTGPRPIDDAAIEQLVRDVAAGWTMPPVRLDAPSWRDRVRSPRARRLVGARRVARARRPGRDGGDRAHRRRRARRRGPHSGPAADPATAPSPPARPTPRATPAPRASALPKLLVGGADAAEPERASSSRLEQGDFALVDLGYRHDRWPPDRRRYGSRVPGRADGSMVCLCVPTRADAGARPTDAEVTLDRFDAIGRCCPPRRSSRWPASPTRATPGTSFRSARRTCGRRLASARAAALASSAGACASTRPGRTASPWSTSTTAAR